MLAFTSRFLRGRSSRAALRPALVAGALALLAVGVATLAPQPSAAATDPNDPLYVPTDRAAKVRLLKRLPRSPQLLISVAPAPRASSPRTSRS